MYIYNVIHNLNYIQICIYIYRSSTNESHNKTINTVYHDPAGYGSITSTFKEAFTQDKTITLNSVKQGFKSNIETTKQVKSSNSFVAPYPYYEYKLELMFFSDLEGQKMNNVGYVLIYVLSMPQLFPSKVKKRR